MDRVDGEKGCALLGDMREQLLSQLAKLADKRKSLEAQREALGEKLRGVDVEMDTKRRMLGLVEATEQQLADRGREELHESEPDHSSVEDGTEVRGMCSSSSQQNQALPI
jgi:GTP cyclohydrolase II